MNKPPTKIAIVGGGIAGLSAAYFLEQKNPNLDFTLFEQNHHLGGNIQTRRFDDYLIETGPDAFLFKPFIAKVIHELGLHNELIETRKENRKSYIVRDGKIKTVPSGFYLMGPSKLSSFLFSDCISWPTKFRTLLEPWIARKKTVEDESLASFVTRRFGKGNLREITQAMIAGIYTADPNTLSLQSTLPKFIEYEQKYGSVLKGLQKEVFHKDTRGPRYNQFRSFQRGMQTLIDAMEKTIPISKVSKNTLVQSIDYHNGQWNLRIQGEIKSFDYLVMATPARAINHLCNFLPIDAKRILKSVPFASTALVHLAFDKKNIPPSIHAMGMIVPQHENRNIIASTFVSEKFHGRCPNDKVLVRIFLGGALQENILEKSDEELIELATTEFCDLLKISSKPVYSSIVRWPDAMPQYLVGHQKKISDFFQVLRNFENLCFLGNTFDGVGIPHLVEKSHDFVLNLLK